VHREIVESLDICWVGIDEGVIVCTKGFLFGTKEKATQERTDAAMEANRRRWK
jgi:hypothetical protein